MLTIYITTLLLHIKDPSLSFPSYGRDLEIFSGRFLHSFLLQKPGWPAANLNTAELLLNRTGSDALHRDVIDGIGANAV